jgi:hypothetical protein
MNYPYDTQICTPFIYPSPSCHNTPTAIFIQRVPKPNNVCTVYSLFSRIAVDRPRIEILRADTFVPCVVDLGVAALAFTVSYRYHYMSKSVIINRGFRGPIRTSTSLFQPPYFHALSGQLAACSVIAKVFLTRGARCIVKDADDSVRGAGSELWKGECAGGEKGENGAGNGGWAHFSNGVCSEL